jgi:hypothetical protein
MPKKVKLVSEETKLSNINQFAKSRLLKDMDCCKKKIAKLEQSIVNHDELLKAKHIIIEDLKKELGSLELLQNQVLF